LMKLAGMRQSRVVDTSAKGLLVDYIIV